LGLRWGSLSAPPDPLAAIWGLLLRGGEGKGGEGRGGKGRGGREGEEREKGSPHFFVQVYAPA